MRIIVILAIIIMNLGLVTNANAQDVCNCRGYDGPGGVCYSGPGGPAYEKKVKVEFIINEEYTNTT